MQNDESAVPLKRGPGRPRKMENRPADSIVSAEERAARIHEESERIEREQGNADERQRQHQAMVDAASRVQEAKNIEIVSSGMTRDHLLDRIRSMREEKPPEIPAIGRWSEREFQELSAEQEAGRRAVAKAEAEAAAHRERWMQEDMEQKARDVQLTPVVHPNPGQNQVFPTIKATLK